MQTMQGSVHTVLDFADRAVHTVLGLSIHEGGPPKYKGGADEYVVQGGPYCST